KTTQDTVVLSGRCYERESVPYKAFDSVVDALSRHLRSLPMDEVAALLPAGIHDLARVFPVLLTVPALELIGPVTSTHAVEPHELRRKAFLALKDLLAALAERSPLVLHVDD